MRDDLRRTVIIPLAAAVITGALAGLLLLALCVWQNWPVIWVAIGAAALALLSWYGWSARFAQILEYQLAPGLPKAQPAPSQAKAQTVNLHIHQEDEGGYLEGAFLDRLPVSDAGLAALANLVISGQSLTTSQITASGLLDRPTWEVLRDRFISAGLLAWRSGSRAHGCEVTGRGMTIFRRLADPTPPAPPP